MIGLELEHICSCKILIMKNEFMILLFMAMSLKGMAQNNSHLNNNSSHHANNPVPEQVWQTFQKDNPHAQYPQLQHMGINWIAIYKDVDHGSYQVTAYYDSLGRQLERRVKIKKEDLSPTLKQQIQNKYQTSDFDVIRYERPGQPNVYQVALNLKSGRTVIYTDEQGQEISYKDPFQ